MRSALILAVAASLAVVLLMPGVAGSRDTPVVPSGSIGVDPVPPWISNFTMEKPEQSSLGEIRVSIVLSDYNGFEDISTADISLYYFNEMQAKAQYSQYEDNTTTKIDRFDDQFGGFLDRMHCDANYIKSSNRVEENTSLKIEFFFKPVPVTDVSLSSKDRTGLGITISISISPSARPSKIKDAYIPWAIAIVIASVATVAMTWIRNGSNRLAKIAEGRKGAMVRPPTGAGGGRR